MQVTVYTSFVDIPEHFSRQLAFPGQSNLFLSLNWFQTLYNEVLSDRFYPRIYLARDGEQLLGALYCCTKAERGTLYSMTSYYSMEFAPVVVNPHYPFAAVSDILLDYIATEKPRWHRLEFRFLKSDKVENEILQSSIKKSGYYLSSFFQYENWYLKTDGKSFDEYYEARPSALKNTIKRKEKKANNELKIEVRYFQSDDEKLPEAIEDYKAVYKNSWKLGEPFEEFIASLIMMSSRLNTLQMGILYVDDLPAAAQLWLTTISGALIYKLAYDEKYKQYSLGSVLSRELFKIAIDERKVSEIDYGVGSEPYKRDWMNQCRNIYGVQAYNLKTLPGLALAAVHILRNIVKWIVRRDRGGVKAAAAESAETTA